VSAGSAEKALGGRHGYGTENLSPFDVSLAVVGTWLKHRFNYDG
jgi:hypothetical protein